MYVKNIYDLIKTYPHSTETIVQIFSSEFLELKSERIFWFSIAK